MKKKIKEDRDLNGKEWLALGAQAGAQKVGRTEHIKLRWGCYEPEKAAELASARQGDAEAAWARAVKRQERNRQQMIALRSRLRAAGWTIEYAGSWHDANRPYLLYYSLEAKKRM